MASAILSQIAASASLTISLASIADGSGRVSAGVSNPSPSYPRIILFAKIKLGTSPNSNAIIELYLIRGDASSPAIQDDNAGTADAAYTALNAQLIGTLRSAAAAATGDVLRGSFIIEEPGLYWSIGVKNRTGVALDATNGNHALTYNLVDLQVQ